MPYIKLGTQGPLTARRVLVTGPPNSFKTTSLATWPRPIHIISLPGEKGYESIPREEGIQSYALQLDPAEKSSSQAIVSEVIKLSLEVVAGKHGPCTTFAGDGLHKLYSHMLNMVTGGAYCQGEDFEPRLYARAHEHFRFYLDRIMTTTTPYVVFTCWDGREPDNPDLKSASPTHVYPDLPGKMAKNIMGEFSIVVYASVKHPMSGEGGKPTSTWQLLPHGKVWGAAIKAPKEVVERIPLTIAQDFRELERVLQAAQTKKETK